MKDFHSLQNNMKIKRQLFFTFLKIGAFTFGGGYAMIPFIRREVVEQHKWITEEDILDILAVSESTPGPMAVNSATFIGYRIAGIKGALVATAGVVLPSFFIILIVSLLLSRFENSIWVRHAFEGIRVGVFVLIGSAFLSMLKKNWNTAFSIVLGIAALLLTCVGHISTILILVICAVTGLVWLRIRKVKK